MGKRTSLFGSIVAAAVLVLAAGTPAVSTASADAPASTDGATTTASAACGQSPTLRDGTHTIRSGGQNRTFILDLPDNYDPNHPYRLVFGLHWWGGTAEDVATGRTVETGTWAYYGLKRLSNNDTIFVAPQGLDNGWANSGGQDVTFVDDMIREIEAGLCVDTTALFASGFSYGGAMAYALACTRASVFRGVVVYSGANLSGCQGGTQPIAYFGIHGLRDGTLPISQGRALRDQFVRNNGCTPQNPPEPPQGSLTHIVTYYSGCKAGYPVVWGAFDGPHAPNAVDGSADPYAPGAQSWTQQVVWNFMTQLSSNPGPTTPPPTTPTAQPPTTLPPTTAPPTSQGPGGACSASYRTVGSWQGGFQGEIRVTAGRSAISSWTVQWTFGDGQSITQLWSGTLTTSGSTVTVRNVSYNGSVPASGSTVFGFLANGTPPTPTLTCTSP
jgi:poly(3-hydroxybutyrate) depolymerase